MAEHNFMKTIDLKIFIPARCFFLLYIGVASRCAQSNCELCRLLLWFGKNLYNFIRMKMI